MAVFAGKNKNYDASKSYRNQTPIYKTPTPKRPASSGGTSPGS